MNETSQITPKKYVEQTRRTRAGDIPDPEKELAVAAMGFVSEAAEVTDVVKKIIGQKHPMTDETKAKIHEEIGDALFYAAWLCDYFDFDMAGIMAANITKLEKRYPDGFDPERSINRE